MFAGLPGVGVGTLFYILIAFYMPFRELPRVFNGTSSIENWRLILRQMFYAVGIIVTVMFAEKVMLWVLGDKQIKPFSPATWVHSELGAHASGSILAAPIMASILLLVGVLMSVELLRTVMNLRMMLKTNLRKPAAIEQPEIDSTTATALARD